VRLTVALLCSSLMLAVACAPGDSSTQGESSDAALAHVLSGYVVDLLRRNPATNTYLGGAAFDPSLRDVDGTLRDHSADALEQEDAWLRTAQLAIEAVDTEPLSPSARIDREVALAQIRFMLRQHIIRRYQERALDTYVSEPFQALDWQIQGLTPTGEGTYGTVEEWTLVIRRLNAVPAYLDTAQEQLGAGVVSRRIPDWRMAQRDGLDGSEARALYFADTLPALAASRLAGPERERLLEELGAAAQQAADSYLKFRDFVAATYFDGSVPKYATNRFAMGEEEYNWALVNNFRSRHFASTIYGYQQAELELSQRARVSFARAILGSLTEPEGTDGNVYTGLPRSPSLGTGDVRAALDALSRDYPRSDVERVSWYREAAARLVAYGRRTDLFDVPADYRLEIVETPPPLHASIGGAAYQRAPAFKHTGVGHFYVTPTRGNLGALQGYSRASLASVAAREGFPGHDWYFKVLAESRDQISPVRWLIAGAVEDSSSMWQDSVSINGWRLYAEALMAEGQPGAPEGLLQPGVPDGAYTPGEHLYQWQDQMYRLLSAQIDTGIHTGRLTYDEATTLLSEIVDLLPGSCAAYVGTAFRPAEGGGNEVKRASCEKAERAVFRISKWPTQASTSWVGLEQIEALRNEAMTRLGDRFSLETFHRLLLPDGPIPLPYVQEALLREMEQVQPSAPSSP
jgi:uncharacterized protein (DUF885 family)